MANNATLITAEAFAKMAGLTPPKKSALSRMFFAQRCSEEQANWEKKLKEITDLYNKAGEADSEANELNNQLRCYCCAIISGDYDFQGEILQASKEADSLDSAILRARDILSKAAADISQGKENLAKVNSAADELTNWIMEQISDRPDGKSVMVLKLHGTHPTMENEKRFYTELEALTPEVGIQSISTCMFIFYVPIWLACHADVEASKLKDYIVHQGFWCWTNCGYHLQDRKLDVSWK